MKVKTTKMMTNKHKMHEPIIMAIAMGICSCGMISINQSGYAELSEAERARVKECTGAVSALPADSNVYRVTAAQMKEYLGGKGDVILYEFTPWCDGDGCVVPQAAEEACRRLGYAFCFVAIGYGHCDRLAGVECPKLVIDTNAYGTENFKKYCRQFFGELTGKDWSKLQDSFHRFSGGHYVRSYTSPDSIPKAGAL